MHRWLRCSLIALLLGSVSLAVTAQTTGRAYYDLGVFAYEEGNFPFAETQLKKALEADPEDPAAHHYMGKTLMAQDRFDAAEKHLDAAWKKDPGLPGLTYDRAYSYYKMGEYGKGADLFSELAIAEPDHILANFYGGVCLYRKGRYRQANTFLTAAAEKSPALKVKGYYFSGLCHYYLGEEAQAIRKLSFVQANSESSDMQANAEKWLKWIAEGKKIGKPYELEVRAGFAYDDNVPLEPSGQDIFADEGDLLLLGYVSGRYHVIHKPEVQAGLGITRTQSWYRDLDAYNASETEGELYGYYYAGAFSYGLGFRPVLYQVDAEDFLLMVQVSPQVTYRVSNEIAARAFYTYSANDYRKGEYNDRDGSSHEGFVDTLYTLSGDRGYLLGGIGYEDNTASKDEYDYGRLNVKLAMEYGTAWDMTLKVAGKYSNKTYKNESSFENKTRQDSHYEGSISLARNLFDAWLRIALEYTYIKNDSNVEDYDYTRQVTGVVVIAEF